MYQNSYLDHALRKKCKSWLFDKEDVKLFVKERLLLLFKMCLHHSIVASPNKLPDHQKFNLKEITTLGTVLHRI